MSDLIRGKIYDNILQTMGNTPLVRFPKITQGVPADLCYKLEFFNPIASVKDRISISMIEALGNLRTNTRRCASRTICQSG